LRPGPHRSGIALLFAAVVFGPLAAAPLAVVLKDAQGQPVADAVVSLIPTGPAPAPSAAPASTMEITQQGKEFSPYVTAVTVGTTVMFPNQDSVQHHVYSLSKAKKFEFPRYAPGKKEALVFDQPGVVTLGCNIHDWMLAYLVVVPTPWFAKTDAAGRAAPDAPAGSYRLEIWHPRLATPVTREISLPAAGAGGAPLAFTLTLKPDRRLRRAPDAKGGGYK
jgi:plastocyanin